MESSQPDSECAALAKYIKVEEARKSPNQIYLFCRKSPLIWCLLCKTHKLLALLRMAWHAIHSLRMCMEKSRSEYRFFEKLVALSGSLIFFVFRKTTLFLSAPGVANYLYMYTFLRVGFGFLEQQQQTATHNHHSTHQNI